MRIVATGLTKVYPKGTVPALDSVDLEIGKGTFGLLGPNGAGKTTLIKILSTQMAPTSGRVSIGTWDLQRNRSDVRRSLGYLPQHFGSYPQLTAWEFMDYMDRLATGRRRNGRKARVRDALENVGLYEARDRRTGTFSGGMMRRLGIAQAIVGDPEILVVDEPTVGLDPEERIRFRGILARLSRDRAILISTHIVGDISSTCDDLAVLNAGRIVYRGSPEALVTRAEGKTWRVQADDAEFETISQRFLVVTVAVDGGRMDLRFVGDGPPPALAEPVTPSLEDAYVYFMGLENAEEAA